MKRATKIWFITAASLVLVGTMIFGGVMTVLGWDFSKLSTDRYENNQHEINEKFDNISVETDTADVAFVLSEDGICRVECYEARKEKHSVTVKDGTLVIKRINEKAWYDYIGIHFGAPRITVYLPEEEYVMLIVHNSTGNIEVAKEFKLESVDISLRTGHVDYFASTSALAKIKTSTGNILVANVAAGALDLSASTGRITVSDVACRGGVNMTVNTGKTQLSDLTCQNLTSGGGTGNIVLTNVLVSGKLSVERTTGDVNLKGCDAAELFVKTDTGDVSGDLLSDKVFLAQTDTGSVNVPKTITGGKCEITTDTGDIHITIQ